MLAVCLQQKVPKIVVWGQQQQIYSFRVAVNALDSGGRVDGEQPHCSQGKSFPYSEL